MVPTTLPGRESNRWLIWCSTIGMMLWLGAWLGQWGTAFILSWLGFFLIRDYSKDRQKFSANLDLYKLVISAVCLAVAWLYPGPAMVSVAVAGIVAQMARKFSSNSEALEMFFELKSLRFCCLLIAVSIVRQCTSYIGFLDPVSPVSQITPIGVLVSLLASSLVIPVTFAASILFREVVASWQFSKSSRFFKTLWHSSTFDGFLIAQLVFIGILTMAPGGPGDMLVGWLVSSSRDANLEWTFPLSIGGWGHNHVPGALCGLDRVVSLSSFNVGVCLKSIMAVVCSVVFLPRMLSMSAFLTSVARRFRMDLSGQSVIEDFLEVLKQPVSKLRMKEAIPWLHNASSTFYWYLFCYALLFFMVCGLPGPLGESIDGWLDFSFTDANFRPHSLEQYPQLRWFFASLVAMIGAIPLAVTGCAFLPSMKAKFISVSADGILLPKGPYLSLWLRPFRLWSDMKAVTIRGRVGETRLNKRTLSISFFSGGSLKLKLHQLSEKDLYDLFSAIDEYADECLMSSEVLELRRSMSEVHGAKALPEEGQLRSISAENFRSTVFIPFSVGETISVPSPASAETPSVPSNKFRVVRQLAAKQLSAVYLVRLADGRLAVAKQFCFPENCPEAERMRKTFQREYELLGRLDHPRTARVIECFEQGNSSILLLEYAKGRDLRDIVERDGARSERAAVEIAIQLCEVMKYLHDQSPAVLHRDLTPDNLVIDEDRDLKLIDFGAAHQFLEGITGTLIGKQCYIAPEQLRGDPTTKSDIYSFGCTIYFLLTGEDPLALSQCDPKAQVAVSEPLRRLIMQCTEFDEKNRPHSFDEIGRTLRDIVEGRMPVQSEFDSGFWIKVPEENVMVTAPSKTGEQ